MKRSTTALHTRLLVEPHGVGQWTYPLRCGDGPAGWSARRLLVSTALTLLL